MMMESCGIVMNFFGGELGLRKRIILLYIH